MTILKTGLSSFLTSSPLSDELLCTNFIHCVTQAVRGEPLPPSPHATATTASVAAKGTAADDDDELSDASDADGDDTSDDDEEQP